MLNRLLCLLVLGLVAAAVPAQAQTNNPGQPPTPNDSVPAKTARVKGKIQVARVVGTATVQAEGGGPSQPLTTGQIISDQSIVTTAANSSAILAFSNGATVSVSANTSLDIQQFEQDPLAGDIKLSDLKQEEGTSTTRLNLTQGAVVGKVVHLNVDKGSEFTVQTPVGAAGIRGTTFQVIFIPNGNGTATFTVMTQEGVVVYTGTASNVQIPAGTKISSTFNYTPGGPISAPVLQTTALTPEEAAAILKLTNEIAAATVNTVFGVTPPAPPQTNSNTPSVPTQPAPATTPGAGSS
jgi:hypothetical protein